MKLHSVWFKAYVAFSDPGVIWAFTIIWSKQAICCAFFGSEIFSLTFLDILNANLSEIETRTSHLESDLFVFLQYLCRKVVRPNWHQNTKYLQNELWQMKLTNLNDGIKVYWVYFDVKLAETIHCNKKSLFMQMNFHIFCPVRNVKKVVAPLK